MEVTFLVDKDIPFLADFMPIGIKSITFDPLKAWEMIDETARVSVTAVVIRTVSRIDETHFDPTLFPNLKCIGTASAGFDHVDTEFLSSHGIQFFDAGGANAQAVAEYVASIVVQWCIDFSRTPKSISVGIVGSGHTGSRVGTILSALGCKIVYNDPPKSMREPDFTSESTKSILDCDVITFHVPYLTVTEYPTRYWLDREKLTSFRGNLVINAARGGVIQESEVLNWQQENPNVRRFVLDVWENEPRFDPVMATSAWIATPHIAGYSTQSKRNATRMILKKLCTYLEITNYIPDSCTNMMHLDAYKSWHPLFELSDRLKNSTTDNPESNAESFRILRQHSILRNEFKFTPIGRFNKLAEFPLVQELIKVCGGPL